MWKYWLWQLEDLKTKFTGALKNEPATNYMGYFDMEV